MRALEIGDVVIIDGDPVDELDTVREKTGLIGLITHVAFGREAMRYCVTYGDYPGEYVYLRRFECHLIGKL